ncbi:transcription factor cwo-like isoform X1 [Limulus polyphemus]|uniref:Transcription factor cwo-like isoform X1 n=1 Tax=Limulus polyphemus TaxID=6850 RepID=A0ABM1TGG2_LIMPO|nr:transcription factor cwo-like isoform X1 [Limulus polyphemus]
MEDVKIVDNCWEDSNLSQNVKIERSLNFAALNAHGTDDDEFGLSRKRSVRDPMSHRIIEKRRRDRMNNCLADLSRLIPTSYLKKGRGRIEKTEIIEMAIKHLKHLQAHTCKDPGTCEVAKTAEQDRRRQYRLGFQECLSEILRFMVEIEGLYASDGLCVKIVNHLQQHYDKIAGGMCYQNVGVITSAEDSRGFPMDVESHTSLETTELPSATSIAQHHATPTSIEQNSPVQECRTEQENSKINDTPLGVTIPPCTGQQAVNWNPSTSQVQVDMETVPISNISGMSQLREMLQNPGLPVERIRNSTSASSKNNSFVNIPTTDSTAEHVFPMLTHNNSHELHRGEEVYKFKKNIKERFTADLQQHASSPVRASDGEERCQDLLRYRSTLETSNTLSSTGTANSCSSTCQSTQGSLASQLSVKIPERNTTENGSSSNVTWDNNIDSSSSCGSNPSPPSVVRSNGSSSSSGYSTGNEMPYIPKAKCNERHTPPFYQSQSVPVHCSSPQPSLPAASSIPIFALHPKGAFYVPLTLDSAILAPFFSGLDDCIPVLHPVSISVNFSYGQQFKIKERAGGDMWQQPSVGYT